LEHTSFLEENMGERRQFATQKQIWWELDKLCISLASQGRFEEADTVERAMKLLKRPNHDECKRFYAMGY
jgi:hypothetical protein